MNLAEQLLRYQKDNDFESTVIQAIKFGVIQEVAIRGDKGQREVLWILSDNSKVTLVGEVFH